MVSEILFGERFDIEERKDSWLRIKLLTDGYEGWIEHLGSFPEASEDFSCSVFESGSLVGPNGTIDLYTGSRIVETEQMLLHKTEHQIHARVRTTKGEFSLRQLIGLAKTFLNTPYYWGGRTLRGIDCSGFVQVVYSVFGIQLPRDAYQQAEQGLTVEVGDEHAGDLAFFNNPAGRITHVGIVVEPGEIIHASEKVRIDRLDETGIWRSDIQKHSHQLHSIKRVLDL